MITAQAQQLGIDQSGAAAAEEDGFPPIPRLNIGGTEFQCRVEHLRSQPGSFLSKSKVIFLSSIRLDLFLTLLVSFPQFYPSSYLSSCNLYGRRRV